MNALRRALYLEAAAWAIGGLALALIPRFTLVSVFDQPLPPALAWWRLLGVNGFGLSLLMVLVAQRAEELWWWSWAFALVSVGTAVVALLHAAFGVAEGESSVVWWLLGLGTAALSGLLMLGLYLTARHHEPG